MRSLPALALICVAVLAAGCGSGAPRAAQRTVARAVPTVPSAGRTAPGRGVVCVQRARRALAGALAGRADRVAMRAGVGSDGDRTCTLSAPAGWRLVVDLNTDPQPYFILERTIVENAQLKSFIPSHPSPQQVPRLGLDAAWFPDADYLLTTDGTRLVKVIVTAPRVPRTRKVAAAKAVAASFLGRLRPKAADPGGG